MSGKTGAGNSGKAEQIQEALTTDSNLETVRDILFGKQLRETKTKEAELEKLIRNSVNNLKKEMQAEFTAMNKALEKLRGDIEKAAAKTGQGVAKEFEDTRARIAELDTATKKAAQDMYDELDTARLALEKDAKDWNERLGQELDEVGAKLRHEKTDRLALAALLSNMAQELAGPDTED